MQFEYVGTVIQVATNSTYVQPIEPSTCGSSKSVNRDEKESSNVSSAIDKGIIMPYLRRGT
ncbi:hypothetical protein MKW94_028649, partial [Papaver nudicaule]|nr:hypothetical protein [Papaver nudicaule]